LGLTSAVHPDFSEEKECALKIQQGGQSKNKTCNILKILAIGHVGRGSEF
jgi:hypothetical protein